MRSFFYILAILLSFSSCVPQMHYVEVERKRETKEVMPFDDKALSVFAITGNKADSIALTTIGIGLSEKIEEDREFKSGSIGVYSIPIEEFSGFSGKSGVLHAADSSYLMDLMLRSGADYMLFLNDFTFTSVDVISNSMFSTVVLPYKVAMSVYEPLSYKVLYNNVITDTLHLQSDGLVSEKQLQMLLRENGLLIAKTIGVRLGARLSVQWEAQERILFSFGNEPEWSKAYALARSFKWAEAMELWMKLAGSENLKKAAYAAFNVAVGCEILQNKELAKKWVDFAIDKYPFSQARELRNYLYSDL